MTRTSAMIVVLLVVTHAAANSALAADSPEPQACVDVAKRTADGSASDRFLREWCQRNVVKAPDAPTAVVPEPPVPTPDYANYPSDNSADRFNSSRMPPGYHCHMLKFGERICHGGLD